ncbi:MAG: amidohydrolase family protein [Anaeromassilibacillus sp.]
MIDAQGAGCIRVCERAPIWACGTASPLRGRRQRRPTLSRRSQTIDIAQWTAVQARCGRHHHGGNRFHMPTPRANGCGQDLWAASTTCQALPSIWRWGSKVSTGKNQAPSTRMSTAALIREQLYKAKRYQGELERAEKDEDFDMPEFDMKCEALLPALRREIQVHFHAHRADDIFTAVRIAQEFQLDYVVVHGTEAHLIAGGLVETGTRVLSGPFLCDRSKPELRNQTPATPGILSGAGVPTAIITDHPVIPIQYLPVCAGLAVREGMDYEEALRAITINPAKICGLDHRLGSLEVGKDADLVLFDQDPLTIAAKPKMVIAGGKLV